MISALVTALDRRLGVASPLRKALRYVFPDHWSFMLGEIALYAFVVLVGTGIYLTLFYVPSGQDTIYHGSYAPLQGALVGKQYASVMGIVFDVPAGNLMRQTHHWAADVFIVAIVLHVLRIALTGAYRNPRELNWLVGVTMLGLAILEGFLGYSLVDDLLSGMGLAIAYAVAVSVPILGPAGAFLVWGGEYPGADSFWPRLEIFHVLVIPVLLATLITIHLVQITRQHHTQFGGERRDERHAVGTPMWPGYALRSLGLFFATAAVLFLLGGLVQINPVWEWGPFHTYLSTNGAQPDWYLGWLIGGMRIMPPFEINAFGHTIVPNAFWGGALFPLVVFTILYLWPWIGRRSFDDREPHNVLDRPRDNPRRTALFLAFVSWVFLVFGAGSADRVYFISQIPYAGQVWFFRVAVVLVPLTVYFVARRVCEELRLRDDHPLRSWTGDVVAPAGEGGWEERRRRGEPPR